MTPQTDANGLPLSFYQSGLLRQVIETEFTMSCLDLARGGVGMSVLQEQALKETIVPAVFFKAMDEGLVQIGEKTIEISAECQSWVRKQVLECLQKLLKIHL